MQLVIKSGYTSIAIPVSGDVGQIIAGMENAVTVQEPGYLETQYKVQADKVTFTFVPDSMIGPADPVLEKYKDDLHRAYEREATERKQRQEVEKELKELKERFAPFIKEEV